MTQAHTNKRNCFSKIALGESFKFDRGFLYIVLIDLVYYAVFFGSIVFFLRKAIPELTVIQGAKDLIGLLTKETAALYQHDLTIIQAARNNVILYGIILAIVLLLNFSCFKLWVWQLITKKKYGIGPLVRGVVVNVMFFILVSLLGFAGYYTLSGGAYYIWLLLLILFSIYFLNWIHLTFAQRSSINAVFRGIFLSVKGFSGVWLPYLLLIILLGILIGVFKLLAPLDAKIYWPLALVAFTLFFNWAKRLLYLVKKNFFPHQ